MAKQPNNKRVGTYTPTTGNTMGVNNENPKGPYAQRMLPLPPMTSGPMAGMGGGQHRKHYL